MEFLCFDSQALSQNNYHASLRALKLIRFNYVETLLIKGRLETIMNERKIGENTEKTNGDAPITFFPALTFRNIILVNLLNEITEECELLIAVCRVIRVAC